MWFFLGVSLVTSSLDGSLGTFGGADVATSAVAPDDDDNDDGSIGAAFADVVVAFASNTLNW